MHFENILLVNAVLGIILHKKVFYHIVKDESYLVIGIGNDLSLQEVIVTLKDHLQLTFLLSLYSLEHVFRTVDNENS